MIDLGHWAAENYRVAGEQGPDTDAESNPKPPES